MDHDQNFKNLILDYPHQALAFFAPEEAADLDAAVRILPIRQEQLKARLGDRFRELDVPLLVEWPDGRRAALLFAVEEQSNPRHFSIHRLTHYCLDLAELFGTERVIPVVIFLRGTAPRRSLILGGDHHHTLSFQYIACELAGLDYAQFCDSDNVVAVLNLPNMRHTPDIRVEVFAHAVRGLLRLEPDRERQLKYFDFIDIYAALDDNERQRYRQRYAQEVTIMSSFVERWFGDEYREQVRQQAMEQGLEQGLQQGMEQGMEQGIQQGMQQGMQRGEAAVLLRQLTRKFGELPVELRQRIEAADAESLLQWSERVLDAVRLDQVLDTH